MQTTQTNVGTRGPAHLSMVLTLALAGCVGAVPQAGMAPPPPAEPPSGKPPAGTPAVDAARPPADANASCTTAVGWRSTGLTREQYINTVSDLLGFDVRPLVKFDDAGGRRFVPGVSLSALGVEQRLTTAEAIAAAAAAPARWPAFVPCDPKPGATGTGEEACADQLVEQFGTRAFRGLLAAEAKAALRALFDAGKTAGGFATGLEWLVAGVLQAPEFLYQLSPPPAGARPGSVVPLGDAALASRLAFFLWNSGPDLALLTAAQQGALRTREGVAARVRQMLADARAARTRGDYYGSWLQLDQLDGLVRDAAPFTPGLVSDLRRSVLAGIEHLYQSGAKAEELWSSPALFVNDSLAKLYQLPLPGAAADFKQVMASAEQRHGLLTHPALLTRLAHPDTSDPIARGVFVEEQVLCQTLPDPAADIPELPPLRAGLSTRQRLEQHRSAPACAACHQLFDPVGLALENYDALGLYRTVDHGVPVDASGEVRQGLDIDGKFAGGPELLARIGQSATARDCLVQRWLTYALRRDLEPADQCAAAAVKQRFAASGDLLDLLAAVAESDAFRIVLVEE
jgi:hypothetical protein